LAAVGALPGRVSDAEVKIDAHREAIKPWARRSQASKPKCANASTRLTATMSKTAARPRFRRSVEAGQAELKDLVLQTLDRRRGQ
jgi:hypothetical protein